MRVYVGKSSIRFENVVTGGIEKELMTFYLMEVSLGWGGVGGVKEFFFDIL